MGFLHIVLTVVLLLCSIANAYPAYLSNYMVVTDMKIHIPSTMDSKGANVSMSFTVQDPNPLANNPATCYGSWPVGSTQYPTGHYVPCNNHYAWNFANVGYHGPNNFTLQIEHIYEDPSLGPPPYDSRSTFARTAVNATSIYCFDCGNGTQDCFQPSNRPMKAWIWMESKK